MDPKPVPTTATKAKRREVRMSCRLLSREGFAAARGALCFSSPDVPGAEWPASLEIQQRPPSPRCASPCSLCSQPDEQQTPMIPIRVART